MKHSGTLFLVVAACIASPGAQGQGHLTIEQLVDIKHPSQSAWSPDGRRIAFVWDRGGVQDVYVVGIVEGDPQALTHHDEGSVDGLFWSADSATVYFERGGDLWAVPSSGLGTARPVWSTPDAETSVVPSHDGSRVVFVRSGALWVRALSDGHETRLTDGAGVDGPAAWSPDDRRLAFALSSSTPRQDVVDYAGSKLSFASREGFTAHVGVVGVEGGAVTTMAKGEGTEDSPRWVDAKRLTLQRISADLKTREVVLADVATGEAHVLHKDVDPEWWSLDFLGADPVPSPDGQWVAFIGDRDGWDHVYVVRASGGDTVQLTHGSSEVSRLAWSPDSKGLAFDVNDAEHPGVRQLAFVEVGSDPGKAPVSLLTSGRGTNIGATWSPDGRRLLYQHTDPHNSADLFVVNGQAAGAPHRLTDSMPSALDRPALVEPRLVHYPSADGQKVPAYLFEPKDAPKGRLLPAIVWVHGDGITQNFDGWHTRRDYAVYYSFHQYLVEQGYVVLAVDYRGSIGYGKAWRQADYRDLGGRDYEDVAAGVAYLKTLGTVDPARVGIWGLSYGGFMTLQGLTVTPDLFACGIDVAGVEDWRDWYRDPGGPWILARMGKPEAEPDLYRRSSPIEAIHKIKRPLLVLAGTADVNVPFVESLRLLDVALKAGKDVEFMMYPGEFHYFQRTHVLRDAWTRAKRFFDEHLRGSAAPRG